MTLVVWNVMALVALAVASELAARRWLRWKNEYFVMPPGLRQCLEIDQDVFPELPEVVRFDVNSDGERGDEAPSERRGLYRVLVGGGSQPECYLLDQDASWPGALHRLLEQPHALRRLDATRVHVGSIARSGVGSEALDLILSRVLPRYPRLSAIIVLVGASDVLRWLEDGAPAAPAGPVRVSDVFRCHPEGPFGWTPQTLASAEVLRRVRRQWLRPVGVHKQAGRWYKSARAMRARATDIRRGMPDPGPMLDHFERHFRQLLQTSMLHADRVLVVHQPWLDKEFTPAETARMWHGGVGQVWRQEVTTYYSFEVVSSLIALLEARAVRVASELRLEQLDLMPLLEQSLKSYYDGFHLTPYGAKTVATAVADTLLTRRSDWVEPRGRGAAAMVH